jgi:hypothetical protein
MCTQSRGGLGTNKNRFYELSAFFHKIEGILSLRCEIELFNPAYKTKFHDL